MLGIQWPFSNIKISNSALTESPKEEPWKAALESLTTPCVLTTLLLPYKWVGRPQVYTHLLNVSQVFQYAAWGDTWPPGSPPHAPSHQPSPAASIQATHPLDTITANRNPKAFCRSETMLRHGRTRKSQAPVAAAYTQVPGVPKSTPMMPVCPGVGDGSRQKATLNKSHSKPHRKSPRPRTLPRGGSGLQRNLAPREGQGGRYSPGEGGRRQPAESAYSEATVPGVGWRGAGSAWSGGGVPGAAPAGGSQ